MLIYSAAGNATAFLVVCSIYSIPGMVLLTISTSSHLTPFIKVLQFRNAVDYALGFFLLRIMGHLQSASE